MVICWRHHCGGHFASAVLAGALLCQAQQVACAQPDRIPTSSDYLLHVWQRDEGLPHNTVSAIAQTRDGYLWIGSSTVDSQARLFPATGGTDSWATLEVQLSFEAGENARLRMVADSNPGPAIDHVRLTR